MGDVRVIDKQVVYSGRKCRLEVHHLETVDGRKIDREVVVHPGAVVILPVLDDGRIVMIRNRRYVANAVLLELPAGTLEPGEVTMNAAGRELLEETGYLAGRLVPLATFYSSPGIMSERMHCYVATKLKPGKTALEPDEDITVEIVGLEDALSMCGSGEIVDGKTIAALFLYDRASSKGNRGDVE